jgi:uncharacterized membrane protein YqaE (UPF0057 family)
MIVIDIHATKSSHLQTFTMKKLLLLSFCSFQFIFNPLFAAKLEPVAAENAMQETRVPAGAAIEDAMNSFKNLSKKEQRSRLKEVKKELKLYKERKRAGDDISSNTLLLVLLAILIPPLAVYLHEGEFNTKFWISLILTILGFVLFGSFGAIFLGSLLGIIYALIVILG